ncbi:MAG: DUF1934 domain-containing protein [Lachnospiraceae bacterium]|nr:DUF1934 domain-containing protein [Lachnospiraceae bacterium]
MEKDKKIPVNITVTGKHEQDGLTDRTEDVYKGFLSKRGSSTYIVYEDTDNKLENRIKITSGRMEIKRPNSNLIYEKDETVSGFYGTPYGNIEIDTYTESFETVETDDKFICRLKGSINMNGSPVSRFTLEIEAAVS